MSLIILFIIDDIIEWYSTYIAYYNLGIVSIKKVLMFLMVSSLFLFVPGYKNMINLFNTIVL